MQLNKFLYQYSVIWFILFFLFVLWAFWPSYFSHLYEQPDIRNHTHGVAMSLWCTMLITQAYLIRRKSFQLHRVIGKWSYVLMTFLILLTFNLIHSRLQKQGPLGTMYLISLALMINGTLALIAIYGLAIYHRKRPLIHARYMICTVFPLFTPLTDRLIYGHFRPLIQYVPTIEGNPADSWFFNGRSPGIGIDSLGLEKFKATRCISQGAGHPADLPYLFIYVL